MIRIVAAFLLSATLAGGCVVRGRATVATTTPDLVYVDDDVRVIADYDEPIFFWNGFYWWYVDGYWYRSTYYTGGWVYVASPPVVIVRIGDPYRYRHYRPHGYVVRHRPVPAHQVKRPAVRDRRSTPPRTRPKVREHRR